MSDLAKLQAELVDLNLKCQQARDNEVRYGLQRSRLEAERAQLLARMIEATQHPAPAAPYAVTWQSAAVLPANQSNKLVTEARYKPDGLPSVSAMVLSVLDNAEAAGLKPKQIRQRVQERYWPEIPADRVASAAWRLARDGKIHHGNGRYWLNGHDPHNN
jgi:hypothetical protein